MDGSGGEHRYMCCMASYGFMGDVMKLSEGFRWMGPARWAGGAAGASCARVALLEAAGVVSPGS